jgi:hypothetical protein
MAQSPQWTTPSAGTTTIASRQKHAHTRDPWSLLAISRNAEAPIGKAAAVQDIGVRGEYQRKDRIIKRAVCC